MHTKNLVIDYSRNGQKVEQLSELLPKFDRIDAFTGVIETIRPVDRFAFMVSAQKEEILGVLYLKSQEKTYCGNAEMSAIYIVSQKQVVCLRWIPSKIKMVQQVIELSVDVSQDIDRWDELQ